MIHGLFLGAFLLMVLAGCFHGFDTAVHEIHIFSTACLLNSLSVFNGFHMVFEHVDFGKTSTSCCFHTAFHPVSSRRKCPPYRAQPNTGRCQKLTSAHPLLCTGLLANKRGYTTYISQKMLVTCSSFLKKNFESSGRALLESTNT